MRTDRQTDRQTGEQTDRQTDRQSVKFSRDLKPINCENYLANNR